MDTLKAVVKVVLALIAIGAGTELGRRGIEDFKKTFPRRQTKNMYVYE